MPRRSTLAPLAIGLALLLGAACSDDDEATRDEQGSIEDEGSVGAFDLEVGDCFDDPEDYEPGTQATVLDLAALPCDQPHDNEAFALIDLEGEDDEFPGAEAVSEEGRELCLGEFEPYVGLDYESSALDFDAYLTPTEESWQQGDREIVCVLYDAELAPLTGSMKGSAE